MKDSQIFALFLIGLIAIGFGLIFKLIEWPLSSLLLIVGMTFEGFAILALLHRFIQKK